MKKLISLLTVVSLVAPGAIGLWHQSNQHNLVESNSKNKLSTPTVVGSEFQKILIRAHADPAGGSVQLTMFGNPANFKTEDFSVIDGLGRNIGITYSPEDASIHQYFGQLGAFTGQCYVVCNIDHSKVKIDTSEVANHVIDSAWITDSDDYLKDGVKHVYIKFIPSMQSHLDDIKPADIDIVGDDDVWHSIYLDINKDTNTITVSGDHNLKVKGDSAITVVIRGLYTTFEKVYIDTKKPQPEPIPTIHGGNSYGTVCLGSTLSGYYEDTFDITYDSNGKYTSWDDFHRDYHYFAINGNSPLSDDWAYSELLLQNRRDLGRNSIINLNDAMNESQWNDIGLWSLTWQNYDSPYRISWERDGGGVSTLATAYMASYFHTGTNGHLYFTYGIRVAETHDWNWYGGDRKYTFNMGDTCSFWN